MSRCPDFCPHEVRAETVTAVLDTPVSFAMGLPWIVHELAMARLVPSRMSVVRVLVQHRLIEPGRRRRQKDSYRRRKGMSR